MLQLNIISKKLKNEIKITKTYKMIGKIITILFFNILLYGVAFLSFFVYLEITYSETLSEANNMSRDAEIYSNKTKTLNSEINEIFKIQTSFISVSNFLSNFSQNVNDGISLSKIEHDKKTKQITITGIAKKRIDLINFKEELKKLDYLDEFEIPMKNLLIKENINFSIETKLENYEF